MTFELKCVSSTLRVNGCNIAPLPALDATNGNRLLDGSTPSATLHFDGSLEVVASGRVVVLMALVVLTFVTALVVPVVTAVVFAAALVTAVTEVAEVDTAVVFSIDSGAVDVDVTPIVVLAIVVVVA